MALSAALVLGHAWAAAQPAPPTGFESCGQVSEDKERLACFDRELALLKERKQTVAPASAAASESAAARASGESPAVARRPPPLPELTPEQAMGLTPGKILELQGGPSATKLNKLSAKIEGVWVNSARREVFRLENGQVWSQVEPDLDFTVQPGDTVVITRGALDSFFMSANTHMNTRVRRAQ
jgi:quercetin dioxygenase-like cupin family protein